MSVLSAENKQLLDSSVDKYLADHYAFEDRKNLVESGLGYSQQHWRQFADLGWLSIPFAEELGGIGGSIPDTLYIMQAFGKALVVEPFVSSVGLAGQAIALGTNAGLREAVIPEIISGASVACVAFEEPGSRGNPGCVALKAEKNGSRYRLTGEKISVINAPQARYIAVSARTSGALTDREGISLFLLDTDKQGLAMESYRTLDGHRAANIAFDALVGEEQLLTEEGAGYPLLDKVVQQGILMLCAEAVGIMGALLEVTREYTSTRKQFGMPLAGFQVLRHRMADMYIAYQGASSLLSETVAQLENGKLLSGAAISVLKVQVNKAARYIGDSAIQLHGGIGMTDELNVGHYVKRLVAISLMFGNTDFHLKRIWDAA